MAENASIDNMSKDAWLCAFTESQQNQCEFYRDSPLSINYSSLPLDSPVGIMQAAFDPLSKTSQTQSMCRSLEMVRSAPPNPSMIAFADGNSARDIKLQWTKSIN